MPEVEVEDQPTGELCEKCGYPMVLKFGRFGKFEACSNFPNCRNAKPHLLKLGIACPNDGGELVERRTKKGRVFYGCANYPVCEWSSWKRPLPQPCPTCKGLLVQKAALGRSVSTAKNRLKSDVCQRWLQSQKLPSLNQF
ncbi:MAG: type I DNA topoisomerase [Anaerolineae bacterium]